MEDLTKPQTSLPREPDAERWGRVEFYGRGDIFHSSQKMSGSSTLLSVSSNIRF